MITIPVTNNSPQIPQQGLLFWQDYVVPNCHITGSTIASSLNPSTVTGTLTAGAAYSAVSASMGILLGNAYVNTNFTTGLGDFTAIAIYKTISSTASGNYQRVLDKSFANGFYIGRNGTTSNSWGGGVKDGSPPYGIFATFPDNQWQMIGLSRYGTSIKLWNKGTVVNSKTGNGTGLDATALKIGRDTAVAYGLNGYCSAVLIYNREMTPAEMTQIYQYYAPRYNF